MQFSQSIKLLAPQFTFYLVQSEAEAPDICVLPNILLNINETHLIGEFFNWATLLQCGAGDTCQFPTKVLRKRYVTVYPHLCLLWLWLSIQNQSTIKIMLFKYAVWICCIVVMHVVMHGIPFCKNSTHGTCGKRNFILALWVCGIYTFCK